MIKCKRCGKQISKTYRSGFCSNRCKYLFVAQQKGLETKCIFCGKELTRQQIRNKTKHCSKECLKQDKKRIVYCKVCGKELTDIQVSNKGKYCSIECYSRDEEVKQKRKQTCLQKYGTTSSLLNESVIEKTKKTNLQRYGVQNSLSSEFVKQKRKHTNLERYGVQNVFQSQQIINKAKQSVFNTYGVQNVMQLKTMREYALKMRLQAHNQRDVTQKIQNSRRKTIYQRYVDKFSEFVYPLFTESEYMDRNKVYRWKCKRCGNQFESKIYTTNFDEQLCDVPRCLKCFPYIHGFSRIQKQVFQYIRSIYNGKIVQNTREVITPFEIDIYLPELKFAIQFDGLFYHSSYYHGDQFVLLNKNRMCKEKGVRLFHILQDEWREQKEQIKQQLQQIIVTGKLQVKNDSHILSAMRYSQQDIVEYEYQLTQPNKWYIKNQKRVVEQSEIYIYDCGNFILRGKKV